MGLFDKKYCDICGEKIGLLGNRKLEDGNLCKDCAKKLSPFFSDRRNSTVEEIREQLAYREENQKKLAGFSPDIIFDGSRKVYIDSTGEQFIVTGLSDWRSGNPDIIKLSQVLNVEGDIKENKEEIFYEDSEGNEKSYTPRRYEYEYEFNITIFVDSPWFDKIELELSDGNRPDSRYTELYREYEAKMYELADVLMPNHNLPATYDGPEPGMYPVSPHSPAPAPSPAPDVQPAGNETWFCPECGTQNDGKFCGNCGCQKPAAKTVRCASCGSDIEYQMKPPKFCPECGSPLQ